MALFRPYERKAPEAADSTQDTSGTPGKPSGDRISSLTPKGERRAKKLSTTGDTSVDVARTGASPADQGDGTKRVVSRTPQKKQGATLTRKQAETQRMQRLHPSLSKSDQRRANRETRYKARVDSWDKVESSPERLLIRDYIDVRWTITEFLIPVMLLLMVSVVATTALWPNLSLYIGGGLYLMLALAIINTWIMWRGFKKVLAERVPNATKRGLLMYMFNRSLMIRRFRRPGPRVERGASI